jgi:hypothetical protein
MGEELREVERDIFSKLTGREREPLQRVDEFAAVEGGKYPPAEPGALFMGPLEAADGVADAAPILWAT